MAAKKEEEEESKMQLAGRVGKSTFQSVVLKVMVMVMMMAG
jgi:hypothetical protein